MWSWEALPSKSEPELESAFYPVMGFQALHPLCPKGIGHVDGNPGLLFLVVIPITTASESELFHPIFALFCVQRCSSKCPYRVGA